MTTDRLGPISLGSCPTCGGPAQFIDPDVLPGLGYVPAGPEPAAIVVRHVELPNIDEDLGGGWRLTGIDRLLQVLDPDRAWRAGAQDRGRLPDVEYGFGDTPSAAYLALKSAIEKRS